MDCNCDAANGKKAKKKYKPLILKGENGLIIFPHGQRKKPP
jgi:hypothetical protein